MKHTDDLNQDDALLQQLTQMVLNNLDNEQFSVEELSEQMGISRSHLHRKLKLLKGQSVSQFIREVRLEEAMKLLQHNVANVSEIAYRVGFNSNSYFHKCFHNHFGYPPGDIKKGNVENDENTDPQTTTPEKNTSTYPPASKLPLKTSHSRVLWKWLGAAAVVLLIVLVVFIYNQTAPVFSPDPPKSIAVLPLDNLSGDDAQEYLSAGLHDALIGELGKISGLRVISKTSTLHYPGRNMLIQEIAQELGVDAIVEGSVFVAGDSLRIHIQLIAPFPAERHLWSQEYYQDIPHVLSMQNNVVRDIVRKIEVNLTPEEDAKLATTRTVNPETYKAYLRGMHYLQKATSEDRKKGLAYLHQAVDNDPADPLAWAGLALGYIEEGHSSSSSDDAFLRAKAAALQALKLDPTLLEARAALGRIQLYYEWEWEAAEQTFRYVNKVNPSMATNHYHYAWYLHLMGRKEEAIREHELAREVDPMGLKNTGWLAWLYAYYGEYQQAEEEVRKTFELDSSYYVGFLARGLIQEKQEKYDEAIGIYQQLVDRYPEFTWLLGCTYAKAGQIHEARKILKMNEQAPPSPWNAHALAMLYAALGDNDEAFRWLRYKPHHAYIPWFRVSAFNPPSFNKDPRFNELLEEMNLPPVPVASEASL